MTARLLVVALAALVLALPAVSAQMPDPRQMSGIPMPTTDVPAGTVVVRVVRGTLDNNVVNHPVELHVGETVQTANTDESGRATFSNLAPGAHAHAVTTVDGERLESSHLDVGASGGLRVMLVAGVGAGAAPGAGAESGPAAPAPGAGAAAVPGEVTFGGDSRIQIEFDDDQVEVFYLLDVENRGAAPVTPKQELVFELPKDAETPALLEGSSTQAALRGHRVSIAGPFAPGRTSVQVAFGLGTGRPRRELRQVFPAALNQVQVIVTQVGAVRLESAQLTSTQTVANQGHDLLMGSGPGLAAGTELRISLSGLPYRSRAGSWVAIFVAVGILAIGAWAAYGGRRLSAADARRAALETRREKLMADLARLEQQRGASGGDERRYAARRQDLVAQLDRVYGELDQHTVGGSV